jgi:CheY-like chemotaxis protein
MVVQQILTFAKKAPVSFVLLDLNAAVKDFTAMLEQTFPRTITFRVELDPALPAVMADRGQVHQVLLNLCVNARDAMPAGGTITIRTTVVPEPAAKARFASAHGRYVRLSVADTGTGMDDKTRRHIFDPFFTTKELGKGTGLGLSVVYGIIQAHRGMIDVESVPGEGTEFEVLLPASDERPAPKERSGADGSRPRARGTLLVVEDEVDVRRAVARALEDEGYEVLAAGDGPSAVESLRGRNGTVDLVILDIGLPGMNGWEAFAAMRGVRPDLRAIVASGYLDPATRSTRPADGVVEYLTKPYETEAILGAVRRALSAKSAAGA